MDLPSISAEEFQKFQAQLLNVREAQITANEARLQAEKRCKLLEEQLMSSKRLLAETKLSNHPQYEELKNENLILRDKLLSTEVSFQLQSSTLRSECHRLTTELEELKKNIKKTIDVTTQTISEPETDNSSNKTVDDIQTNITIIDSNLNRLTQVTDVINIRLTDLESNITEQLAQSIHSGIKLKSERDKLLSEVNNLKSELIKSRDSETELVNEIACVKRRSEKLNKELRRQLGKALRNTLTTTSVSFGTATKNTSNEVEIGQNLVQSSVYSSLSSLSMTSANIGSETQLTEDGSGLRAYSPLMNESCLHNNNLERYSAEDLKSVILRLSEIQDDNCALRKQNERLNLELVAKTKLIRSELHRYLSTNPSNTATMTPNHNNNNNNSFINLINKSTTNGGLSSIHQHTVERLKLLCEQLMTQNMQLTDQLNQNNKS